MEKGRAPYGLRIIHSCLACSVREDRLFCRLSSEALAALDAIRQTSLYPAGAVLFVEGQPCRGLFILCSGKAKLTTSSARGRSLIVRVAEEGEVLGLSAAVSHSPYDVSAETLEPAQVNFLPREDFLRFLHQYGEVSVRVAQQLSAELHRAHRQMARIALAPSARAKLAGLLLEWGSSDVHPPPKGSAFQLALTHAEVGELIGSSRETVARILGQFRRQNLVQVKGTLVTLLDPARLEALTA
jgi:CRP/FNR family transcriptional regulator